MRTIQLKAHIFIFTLLFQSTYRASSDTQNQSVYFNLTDSQSDYANRSYHSVTIIKSKNMQNLRKRHQHSILLAQKTQNQPDLLVLPTTQKVGVDKLNDKDIEELAQLRAKDLKTRHQHSILLAQKTQNQQNLLVLPTTQKVGEDELSHAEAQAYAQSTYDNKFMHTVYHQKQ